MARKIDKQIEDAWTREVQGVADGNSAMTFASRVTRRALQKSKRELVSVGDLSNTPDTPKPPKPKAKVK